MSSPSTPQRCCVHATIDESVASRAKTGLHVPVVHQGSVVVDAVAAIADPRTGTPEAASTSFFATSTGKGVASSVAHVLVEHGELRYDQHVARRCQAWPELGAHGKADVTLRDALVHSARRAGPGGRYRTGGLGRRESCVRVHRRPVAVVGARHRDGVPRPDLPLPPGRVRPLRNGWHTRRRAGRAHRRAARRRRRTGHSNGQPGKVPTLAGGSAGLRATHRRTSLPAAGHRPGPGLLVRGPLGGKR